MSFHGQICLFGLFLFSHFNIFYTQINFMESTIIFDMSMTYICSAFIGVFLNNILVEKFSLRVRVTIGYTLSFVMLLFIAVGDVGLSLFNQVTV